MNINATTPNNDPSATQVVDDRSIPTPLTDETLWWMARESSAYVLCQKLERRVNRLQREVTLLSSQPWPVLKERDELRRKVEEISNQKEAMRAHVDHQAQIFAWQMSDRKKINERLTCQLAKQTEANEWQAREIGSQRAIIAEKCAALNRQQDHTAAELGRYGQLLLARTQDNESLTKTNKVLMGTIDELRSNLNSYEVTLGSYKTRVKELSAQIEQPYTVAQLMAERANATTVQRSLRDENARLRASLSETTQDMNAARNDLVKLKEEVVVATNRHSSQLQDILRGVKEVTQ